MHVLHYIYDVLIGCLDLETDKNDIQRVLVEFKKFRLQVKREKVKIFEKEVQFLGHQITKGGFNIKPYLTKLKEETPEISEYKTLQKGVRFLNVLQ